MVDGGLGGLEARGERVKDAPDLGGPFFFENPSEIRLRVSVVNDNGQLYLASEPDLAAEDLLLELRCGEVVVVVEPDLADGDDVVPSPRAR